MGSLLKPFYFLMGLPRSGSTVLQSILNQNPKIYVSPTSPVLPMMEGFKEKIELTENFQAYPDMAAAQNILKAMPREFYAHIPQEIIIDKNRSWGLPPSIDLINVAITTQPKFIITVRDIPSILASFVTLNNKPGQIQDFNSSTIQYLYRPQDDVVCDILMQHGEQIDESLMAIATVLFRKLDYCLIEYDDLVADPKKEINKIYSFLELEPFEHDFNNIINKTPENDVAHGWLGLHDIRPELKKTSKDPAEVLSEYVLRKYSGLELWRDR